MRSFAEERRSGTLEGLLTAPVSALSITLAKFAAAFAFFALLWLPGFAYVSLGDGLGGAMDFGLAATNFLAVLLLGSVGLCVGLFASSLCGSQVLAATLAIGTNMILTLPALLPRFFEDPEVQVLLERLSLHNLLNDSLRRGLVDTGHVVLFAALSCLFLGFTVLALEVRRWR